MTNFTTENNDRILVQTIEEELKKSYLDYAMSVIKGRALPDFRDGLKPVQRRILYAMHILGMKHNQPFKKCARIVGEVLGKFHPHGDQSVYDALVRMAQDFSLRYPLIDGQGNMGSIDGDPPAAMRYTEARLSKLAEELLEDIEKETVDFSPNFDSSLEEPVVLPSKVPNLLINGSSGIAVGMATNIPPHNIKEICEAVKTIIDNPDISLVDLMKIVKGPDFPTGAIICGKGNIVEAYRTGQGKITVIAKIEEEKIKGNSVLVIKEIPYQVNKAMLLQEIAEKIRNGEIEGIADLRDESDRKGMRIVIELKKGASVEVVRNRLLKHTTLKSTHSIILLGILDKRPQTLGLKDSLNSFLLYRKDIVRKRTQYELNKAEERKHIVEGLVIALSNIDDVVKLIKKSKSIEEARNALIKNFNLTKIQADAILDMKLQKLTSLETDKINDELKSLNKLIKELREILADEKKISDIIKNEMDYIIKNYGDERRTEIEEDGELLEEEELIEEEDVVITVSNQGYIKRTSLQEYRVQNRGGVGVIGAKVKEEDYIADLFITKTHNYLLLFTNKGNVFWKKAYQIPSSSREGKGRHISNIINLEKDENITTVISLKGFDTNENLLMVTKKGVVKKTPVSAYSNPRNSGIIAITLDENDEVCKVLLTSGKDNIFIASKEGMAVLFEENDVRSMGRIAHGVRGIRLEENDYVVGAIKAREDETVLSVTEKGYGKRTAFSEYRLISRGGKGVINIKCTEKNGKVIDVLSVRDEDEIIIASEKGTIIRTKAGQISEIGRNTQGVRVMKLRENDRVVSIGKVVG